MRTDSKLVTIMPKLTWQVEAEIEREDRLEREIARKRAEIILKGCIAAIIFLAAAFLPQYIPTP